MVNLLSVLKDYFSNQYLLLLTVSFIFLLITLVKQTKIEYLTLLLASVLLIPILVLCKQNSLIIDFLFITLFFLFIVSFSLINKFIIPSPVIYYYFISMIFIYLTKENQYFDRVIFISFIVLTSIYSIFVMKLKKISMITILVISSLLIIFLINTLAFKITEKQVFIKGSVIFFSLLSITIIYTNKLGFKKNDSPTDELFDLLMDCSDYILFNYDMEHNKFLYLSPNIHEILGFTVLFISEHPGIIRRDIVHKDDYPVFEYAVDVSKDFDITFIMRLIKRDKSVVWTQNKYRKVFDAKAKLKSVKGVIKDITKEKNVEFALNNSNRRYKELFDNANDIIILFKLDENGMPSLVTEINKFGKTVLNYVNKNIDQIHANFILTDASLHYLSSFITTAVYNRGYNVELTFITSSGNQIISDSNVMKLFIDQLPYLLVMGRDITEKNRIKQRLKKLEEIETLSLIAGGIAHDFNNILTSLIGDVSLSLLAIRSGGDCEEYLVEAEKITYKAKDLTQQLLTFSKEGVVFKENKKIHDLIKEISIFSLRGSNLKCNFHFTDVDIIAKIDESQISRVISNLVINAKQAMENGGVIDIFTKLIDINDDEIQNLVKGSYIEIAIHDNGSGIDHDNVVKIFTPFFTTKKDGNGLGLASSFSIVENHKGTITLFSQYGKGTTFTVYLPVTVSKPVIENTHALPMREIIIGRILVMDDDEAILKTTGKMLSKIGYKVDYATNGTQAIELYKKSVIEKNVYNLLIFDLTIPGGMGGKEAIDIIHNEFPDVRAIVSSGYSNDDVMANYKKYFFYDRLPKPYTFDMLKEVVFKNI